MQIILPIGKNILNEYFSQSVTYYVFLVLVYYFKWYNYTKNQIEPLNVTIKRKTKSFPTEESVFKIIPN